jgi:tetratricopeptide (TPR) repeat protein
MMKRSRVEWVGLASAALVGLAIGCGTSAAVRPDPPPPSTQAEQEEQLEDALAAFVARDAEGAWTEAACDEAATRFRRLAEPVHTREAEVPRAPELAADALYMAGMAHQRCGDREAAASAYREALIADASHCRARVGLGLAQLANGRADRAEQSFRTAIQHDHQCADAYLNVAQLERGRGDLDGALTNLRRALAIESAYVEALHEMALVHLDRSADDIRALTLAEVVCEQARQIDPDYAPLFNTWGVINVQQGRIVDALGRFERAFTLDPTLYEAWMNFGQITLSFRGYDDAENAFTHAVELRPDSYDALIGLGVALRGLDRTTEAEERYEMARALDPERPEAWFNLGILHQDHLEGTPDDLAEAMQHLTTFLEKANGQPVYADEVSEVSRCCAGGGGRSCRPGRLQNLRAALRAMGRRADGC